MTKFKINWDGSEGATENSENVPPPKRDPNQLSDNSQVTCVQSGINLIWQELLPLFFVNVNYDLNPLPQSMDTPLKSTNGLSASAPMEIE